MNFIETYHMTGLKTEKTILAQASLHADRSIYQLWRANRPQNMETTLFSRTLQELIYVMSMSIKEDRNRDTVSVA